MRLRLVATGLAVAALAGCSFGGSSGAREVPKAGAPSAGVRDPAGSAALQRFYRQKLTWSGCGDGLACGSVVVPVNWAEPAGKTLRVGLNRLPASGKPLGALVLNPGGPGVSGLEFLEQAGTSYPEQVREHYDLVGFDPRGVGRSSAVQCLPDSQVDTLLAADATPDDAAELRAAVAGTRRLARACQANTGALLRHVDTISVVRDLDVMRAALGQSRLNFLGASYGTFIGAWYAQTFPWRVGRMVLDGAIDPSLSAEQYVAGQAQGFTGVLRSYVADCLAGKKCPLRGSTEQALDQLARLVDEVDRDPLPGTGGRQLTQSLMLTGISQALYSTQFWPILTVALTRALAGDGSGLLALADVYYRRDRDGRYSPDVVASNPAIYCLDNAETRTPAQIRQDAIAIGRRYGELGEVIGWGALTCAEWPIKAVVPHERLTAVGAPPILVLGTVNDPATPYAWARALAAQLSSGRLLTWQGDVHTAYRQGSSCVDDAVDTYLLSGDLPATGTRCR